MLSPTFVSDFENNLILYFFSAMPQVLGTMLALLGAFYPSRSGNIRNEIRDFNNLIQKKIYEIDKKDALNIVRRKHKDHLTAQLQESDKLFADRIYNMGKQDFQFYEDYVALYKYNFLEHSFEEIRKFYTHFIEDWNQSYEAFYEQISRIREQNSDFEAKYPALDIDPPFSSQQIVEILLLMGNSNKNIELFYSMKQRTKDVFVFNGCILVLFIISFLFLKYTSNSSLLHDIFLYVGAVIASTSAYSMIYYVYNSVSGNVQTSLFGLNLRKRCKNLFLWAKKKWGSL